MANFSTIKQEDCTSKSIPEGLSLDASKTLVLQSVINAIKEHGRSSMHNEVCGVLVGELCWDKEAYLLIDARIEGKFADHKTGSVTFTSETWDYIHLELAEKYPNKKIVGWYHTHPGFGIFLSHMDFFIHDNFFKIPWQPAYVFDPQAETDGFFFWNENNLEQQTVTIIPDVPLIDKKSMLLPTEKISMVLTEDDAKRLKSPRRSYTMNAIILALLLLILGMTVFSLNHQIKLQKENKLLREKIKQLQESLQQCATQPESFKPEKEFGDHYGNMLWMLPSNQNDVNHLQNKEKNKNE